jgi:hypothetical protein
MCGNDVSLSLLLGKNCRSVIRKGTGRLFRKTKGASMMVRVVPLWLSRNVWTRRKYCWMCLSVG